MRRLRGDPDAAKALELLVQGAAGAIRALGVTIAPEHVVIGGGLRKIGAPLIEGIREALTPLGKPILSFSRASGFHGEYW